MSVTNSVSPTVETNGLRRCTRYIALCLFMSRYDTLGAFDPFTTGESDINECLIPRLWVSTVLLFDVCNKKLRFVDNILLMAIRVNENDLPAIERNQVKELDNEHATRFLFERCTKQ
jgi:hypothetical protein